MRGALGNLRKGCRRKMADIPGAMIGGMQFRGIMAISHSRAYVSPSDEEHRISTSLDVRATK